MENVILNRLPVPTFRWLKVNEVIRAENEFGTGAENVIQPDDDARIEITGGRNRLVINAAENSRREAVVFISGSEGKTVVTEVNAAAGAEVKLVQVYENSGAANSSVNAEIAENAALELIQLYIGGADTVSGINAELAGRCSKFRADIGYLLDGTDKLDINLTARHSGKKSSSEIAVKGVMRGHSEKIFRGTIDFLKGAAGAKGKENEDVLTLDETVRSKTVPLILCAEEDVEGSHGAVIGRIDEDQMFYMQSRGIPEEKIYEMMARAQIAQIAEKTGDSETIGRVGAALGGGDSDEQLYKE